MDCQKFWNIIENYNLLMRDAIEGPNCTDLYTCQGDCCSIKIDVPKILAKEYIKRGYALSSDFIRSNVFSFQLRFDEKIGKCFLFDQKINGCSVHESGIKPPQCWIYPTNFSNPEKNKISCKRMSGWKIIDDEKAREAEFLLKEYVDYCLNEADWEIKKIGNRIDDNSLRNLIIHVPPSHLGGFKDTWDDIKTLDAEGHSFQMKKFCTMYNENCKILHDNFMECKNICDIIATKLINFLKKNLSKFISENEPDVEGNYPLFKLFSFRNG